MFFSPIRGGVWLSGKQVVLIPSDSQSGSPQQASDPALSVSDRLATLLLKNGIPVSKLPQHLRILLENHAQAPPRVATPAFVR